MPSTTRPRRALLTLASLASLAVSGWIAACVSGSTDVHTDVRHALADAADAGARWRHSQAVMKSSYCATCHPDIYAEHEENTHGRAFTDEEVRLATGRFSQGDCIVCHTPRPTFETGIGMNPIRRHHDLEEGNTCMTCHWRPEFDYGGFQGGPDCKGAFDPRVGLVEACASCHRNHGTPYQWELAPKGQVAGNLCIDCHMPLVERPVAVGEAPRAVRTHRFPGARDEAHVRRAYDYEAKLDGNEVVVRVKNKGAGHNFPTELKQRSVESLVIVHDAEGREISRSRMIFRDPYKRPYGLTLLVNTQIPSGETREHRVPIGVAEGSVTTELHFKHYFPLEDHHPALAQRLEMQMFPFRGITPSTKTVETEPEVRVVTPEGIAPETASVANLVDYARPKIGTVDVAIPAGSSHADIDRLIELFQFPVLQANLEARTRLKAIGLPAVPALVKALGSWDNKTWNQSMAVLEGIGEPAGPALVAALEHEELYVRLHACEVLGRMGWKGDRAGLVRALRANLARPTALDRSHAAVAIGQLHIEELEHELHALLADPDPDVTRGAARALAHLGDTGAVPALRLALERAVWDETRRDLAEALGRLGDASGIPVLLRGLELEDDLVRESFFEALFAVTGRHFGFEPLAPPAERKVALTRWQTFWAKEGGASHLRPTAHVPWKINSEARKLVEALGGSDGSVAPVDDEVARARLVELGERAIPALTLLGLKYPAGFAEKRVQFCRVLAEIRHPDAAPALIAALRDPVISVAAWANHALEAIGDREALVPVQRYHQRLLSLAARGGIPASAGTPDVLIAQACTARLKLGDTRAEDELVALLLSNEAGAAATAAQALRQRHGAEIDIDPNAPLADRRVWVEAWKSQR